MIFIRQHIISICVIIFIGSILFKTNRESVKSESIIKQKNIEIETLTQKYEEEIDSYRSQLMFSQNNDIIKTFTVYKPNGERTETKIVDKTVKHQKLDISSVNIKENYTNNIIRTKYDESEKASITESNQLNYLLGLTNLQSNSTNLADHPLLAGVRIPFTNIFTFVTIPVVSDFYKHTTLNFAYSF
jgi:hypothetical protein